MVRFGSTEYSREPIHWRYGAEGLLVARLAIDIAPSGAQYMRMASDAENAMLDRIIELEAQPTDEAIEAVLLEFDQGGYAGPDEIARARHRLTGRQHGEG